MSSSFMILFATTGGMVTSLMKYNTEQLIQSTSFAVLECLYSGQEICSSRPFTTIFIKNHRNDAGD